MKDWKFSEAVNILLDGSDTESVKEITKDYPLFALAASKNDLAGVVALFNKEFSLGKVCDAGSANEGEKAESKKSKKEEKKDEEPVASGDLEDKTVKELIKICDDRGISVPRAGKNKQFYIKKIKQDSVETTEDDTDEWTENVKDPYEGKTAKELFLMCKDRGIVAPTRKPEKYYSDLLKKDDEKKAKEEKEAESDDWGDEEEKETPSKSSVKQDDGDDWDI